MGKNIELIRQNLDGGAIRAIGEAIGFAVAITDSEFITGKARLFSSRKGTIQRFPLSSIARIETIPNPSANLMEIRFAPSDITVTVMYGAQHKPEFERIESLLREALQATTAAPVAEAAAASA